MVTGTVTPGGSNCTPPPDRTYQPMVASVASKKTATVLDLTGRSGRARSTNGATSRSSVVATSRSLSSEKPSKLDGYDGRELIFEGPGAGGKTMKGQARIYASADPPAAYMAFAVNVTGGADEDATPFLDSLHVGKGTDAK
jgi:hypothetical protein